MVLVFKHKIHQVNSVLAIMFLLVNVQLASQDMYLLDQLVLLLQDQILAFQVVQDRALQAVPVLQDHHLQALPPIRE